MITPINPDDSTIRVLRADLDMLAHSVRDSLEMLMRSTSKALHSINDRLQILEKALKELQEKTDIPSVGTRDGHEL